jgi:small subunit ribosomal protein S8e
MAITQTRSNRKLTGGKYRKLRKKRKKDFGSDFYPVKIDEEIKKNVESLGKTKKQRILQTDKANVFDASGKAKIVKILDVEKNPANPHFVRMGIITKGAVIKTELGLAKIVSRPGQHGVVNAVLIKEKK